MHIRILLTPLILFFSSFSEAQQLDHFTVNDNPRDIIYDDISSSTEVGPPALPRKIDDEQQFSSENTIRGVVSAANEAAISVGLAARIISLPYKLGDHFQKGETLVKFDCRRLEAEYQAFQATHLSLLKTQKSNEELYVNGAAGALDVEISKADVARAAAEVKAKAAEISECSIVAPYSGYVAERHISLYETSSPGSLLLTIIDDSSLEIKLLAPSSWLAWLQKNDSFTFRVDETGADYTATITRTGVTVDSLSQTVNLIAQFTDSAPDILSGMSGTAIFSTEKGE